MSSKKTDSLDLTFKELDKSTWSDFAKLFSKQKGVKGFGPGGCWCIAYHRNHSREQEMKIHGLKPDEVFEHNKKQKRELVAQGRSHGIIVYAGDQPVGWCQYGMKEELPRIDGGRFYKRLALKKEKRLWRITCFVVDRYHRKRGIASSALKAVLASIERQGGGVVEAYPVESVKGPSWLWPGTISMFAGEGFKTVARLGESHIVRKTVR